MYKIPTTHHTRYHSTYLAAKEERPLPQFAPQSCLSSTIITVSVAYTSSRHFRKHSNTHTHSHTHIEVFIHLLVVTFKCRPVLVRAVVVCLGPRQRASVAAHALEEALDETGEGLVGVFHVSLAHLQRLQQKFRSIAQIFHRNL